MLGRLAHRGPDGSGQHVTYRVALGHARLAINDLSDAGRQPLANGDASIWATVNGEIYDWRVHAAELAACGRPLRTRCDSEIVVHAYDEHGDGFVERLNGMWAFALWDGRRQRLLLSRSTTPRSVTSSLRRLWRR